MIAKSSESNTENSLEVLVVIVESVMEAVHHPRLGEAPPLQGGVCRDVSSVPRAVSAERGGGLGGTKRPSLRPPRSPGVTAGSSQISEEKLAADVQSSQ